jgi:2-dehydropantoate 2-reductase
MRFIIYGAGAIGSVIGGRLHQVGVGTVLVARPAHASAINESGLLLRSGLGDERIDVQAVTSLDELTPGPDDIIVITAKTQDTTIIHEAILRWNRDAAIVCATNGVEHERMALRRFERVYAMLIQMPASFEVPGRVSALCAPVNALLDVGRFPNGVDESSHSIAQAINSTGSLLCEADPNVMTKKYAKILLNLGNGTDAACGRGGRYHPAALAAQDEAKAVFAAAGISYEASDAAENQRYKDRLSALKFDLPEGETFLGGSTWQALSKGAASLETDYFNGEIALLGRLHGVPTPHNNFLQRLAHQLLTENIAPGSMTDDELTTRWKSATGS